MGLELGLDVLGELNSESSGGVQSLEDTSCDFDSVDVALEVTDLAGGEVLRRSWKKNIFVVGMRYSCDGSWGRRRLYSILTGSGQGGTDDDEREESGGETVEHGCVCWLEFAEKRIVCSFCCLLFKIEVRKPGPSFSALILLQAFNFNSLRLPAHPLVACPSVKLRALMMNPTLRLALAIYPDRHREEVHVQIVRNKTVFQYTAQFRAAQMFYSLYDKTEGWCQVSRWSYRRRRTTKLTSRMLRNTQSVGDEIHRPDDR